MKVEEALADGSGYRVSYTYDPPATDYDVYLRKGSPPHVSPDIWVDNPQDGGGYHAYDGTAHSSAGPVDEQPIRGQSNRIYARVHNHGPAKAQDVRVEFRLSSPYHTVGGKGSFHHYGVGFIEEIPSGKHRDVFVAWTPPKGADQHHCVEVQLLDIPRDTNAGNDRAQQNLKVVNSSTASPYEPVSFDVQVTNPDEDRPNLLYFEARGVPPHWDHWLSPTRVALEPGETATARLHLQPPETADPCTRHDIEVVSWIPRGDTLVRLGGASVDLRLHRRTWLDGELESELCGSDRRARLRLTSAFESPPDQCATITASGCTSPPIAGQTITIAYTDPDGLPVYHEVTTDQDGCFEDFLVAPKGGAWTVTMTRPAEDCWGPSEWRGEVEVPLLRDGDADDDGKPDAHEFPGDADGDGLVNHRDSDSDGDGLKDGDEAFGDVDGDGLANVIDPDSDNDGLLDGEDPQPWGEG